MSDDDADDSPTYAPATSHSDAVLRTKTLPHSPWVFKKMVLFPPPKVPNGSFVALRDKSGLVLAHGLLNRRSEIAFRALGAPTEGDLRMLLRDRLTAAHDFRTQTLRLHEVTDGARIVHGEADGLSGLVVDRYGTTLVAMIYALGWVRQAEILESELRRLPGVEQIVFIGDARSAELEGFQMPAPRAGLSAKVREHGVTFDADLSQGHKTGIFLDQRDNRSLVSRFVRGKSVLDLCTNAGGFAIHAKKRGHASSVVGVDLDEKAIERARKNAKLNQVAGDWIHADLFDYLRERREANAQFDVIVLDPHKLAAGRGEVQQALSKYRDMNRLALETVKPGGLLFTFSCSGAVSEEQFFAIVQDAARQARRRARVVQFLGAAPDHPVGLDFPEGRYLKGLFIAVS